MWLVPMTVWPASSGYQAKYICFLPSLASYRPSTRSPRCWYHLRSWQYWGSQRCRTLSNNHSNKQLHLSATDLWQQGSRMSLLGRCSDGPMTSWADILKQVSYSQMSSLWAHSSRFSATDLCRGPYSSIRLLRTHHTHFQAKWLVPALVPLFKLWAPFWVGGGLDALVWWLTGHAGASPRLLTLHADQPQEEHHPGPA